MAGSSGVTAQYLRDGFLRGLISAIPALADPSLDEAMADAIAQGEAQVQMDLGTRFQVTHFLPQMDAGVLAPVASGVEYEFPYTWPGRVPGDGFTRIKVRVRPIVQIVSMTLYVPGALIPNFPVPLEWLRVDRQTHEIMVAPTAGSAAYALAFGQGFMNWRLPATVQMEYYAGLDETGLSQWPQIKRLVALRSMLLLMPTMSLWVNPGQFSSESADGLTQSRNSAYMFKDMEDRLEKEAETLLNRILDVWEGPSMLYL